MNVISCALALLAGLIGAGFASGREIARFFSAHGAGSLTAILCAVGTLAFFFLRLCARMEQTGTSSLTALCGVRFGARMGRLCSALFFLLCAVTGGAMLAACAEICALTLPLYHGYGAGMALSLLASALLALRGAGGLGVVGAALCALLPALMLRLLLLPAGEACFLPAMSPDLPLRAASDGVVYAALNAAMLCGASPLLLSLRTRERRHAVALLCGLFFALLFLGSAVCTRHLQAVRFAPMPFLALSRRLSGGYGLVAACLYAASLSTLAAMLAALMRLLPFSSRMNAAVGALCCAAFARIGFSSLVSGAYPVLGAVCAGLLVLLCV